MNTKHYDRIAATLAHLAPAIRDDKVGTYWATVACVADAFADANPRFDRDTFMARAGFRSIPLPVRAATPLTWEAMGRRQTAIAAKAKQVRQLMIKRAEAAVVACGLDPESFGCTGHNALLDFQAGRPWAGVDYPMLRRARWLFEQAYRPERIASESWNRLYAQWRADGFQYETENTGVDHGTK